MLLLLLLPSLRHFAEERTVDSQEGALVADSQFLRLVTQALIATRKRKRSNRSN